MSSQNSQRFSGLQRCTQIGTLERMGTSKEYGELDSRISDLLAQKVSEREVKYRALAAETGMSLNRVGKILRKEPPPATLGEIDTIAKALGSSAGAVVSSAERAMTEISDESGFIPISRKSRRKE